MKQVILTFFLFTFSMSYAQVNQSPQQDSSFVKDSIRTTQNIKTTKSYKTIHALIIPAAMITYGFVSLEDKGLQHMDTHLRNEIREDNPHFHTLIDNYMQYSPGAAVYLLNMAGLHGEHNFRDRTMLYLLANSFVGISTQSLKAITRVQRPDGFGTNAFPSGHTATAFAGAEFLRKEYANVSPWYGIAGYTVATATGILRMYNNRHWFRDVVAGAGYGILSTDLAYWLYPSIQKKLWKSRPAASMIMPYYNRGSVGASLIYTFRK